MPQLKNQWIRSNPKVLVVILVMFGKKTLLAMTLIFHLAVQLFGSGNIVMKSSATSWSLTGIGTKVFLGTSAIQLSMTFSASGEYKPDGPPDIHTIPAVAIEIENPGYRFVYGNVLSDSRLSVFTDSGFQLSTLGDKILGPIKVSPIAWDLFSRGSWNFAKALSDNVWLHLFSLALLEPDTGLGIGGLLEIRKTSGVLRFAGIALDNQPKISEDFTIEYGARPIGRGFSIYGAWSGKSYFLEKALSIQPRIVIRVSQDQSMGTAITALYRMNIEFNGFSLDFGQLLVPSWTGAIGGLGYRTHDAPLRRDSLGLEYRSKIFKVNASYRDSWWRQTVYAGDCQRRIFSARVEGTYFANWGEFGLFANLEKRNNRSGTNSKTIQIGFPFLATIASCEISFSPSLRWGANFSFRTRLAFDFELDDIGNFVATVNIGRQKSQMTFTYTRNLPRGQISLEFSSDGFVAISCSIALGE